MGRWRGAGAVRAWVLVAVGLVGCTVEPPPRADTSELPPRPPLSQPSPDAGTVAVVQPDGGACIPQTAGVCYRASCGEYDDGCGGKARCGTCADTEVCRFADGHTPGVCETPVELASCTAVSGREAFEPFSGGVKGLHECVADGWCTDNGHLGIRPALWGFSTKDVWAVGGQERAVALHWDGAGWTRIPTPAAPGLRSVWGASPSDVWAVGLQGTVLRWDGSAWRALASGTTERLEDVHGTAADDVWLVGPEVALHWDGTQLSRTPGWIRASVSDPEQASQSSASVWAVDRDTVFAGHSGGCQRWSGARWETTPCAVPGVTDIWASGPSDVWVVGTRLFSMSTTTYRAHWDGRQWKTESVNDWENPRYERWSSVWGSGPKDVWVSGTWHFDGTRWHRLCSVDPQDSLWGMPGGPLLGGSGAGLARFDGSSWQYTATLRMQSPSFVLAPTGTRLALDNLGAVLERDGGTWRSHYLPPGPAVEYGQSPRSGVASDDLWNPAWGLHHWDGKAWSNALPGKDVRAVWAVSRTDAWAVGVDGGHPRLWRWDGSTWLAQQDVALGSDYLTRLWGGGPSDIWAAGFTGDANGYPTGPSVVWHWDGERWARVGTVPGVVPVGLFGTGGRLWALSQQAGAGTPAALYEWQGGAFVEQQRWEDARGGETQLAGTSATDVWANVGLMPLGEGTRLRHFDGSTWSERPPLPGWIISLGSVPGVATYALDYDGILYERGAP
ncbi:hypothetical protein FGE12_26475 [Aggregicoccus sp. 17bor-14]|uniref:hypothetical protein n=1 Tax=Myxococcaceae TaxID=31 RepID=UPI00129C9471|nr:MULTISPECIES: hypothetical protein [Myxococcaceae]MBF5045986.1 hypothetical protein [Simulacricoccus sp. 17bor-14]MRI91717.1 hypothetical protein [Aggregicoccus sp. 17bor-14]